VSGGIEGESPRGELANQQIDQARQKIVEHLKDATLASPRFQAFADLADLCFAAYNREHHEDGIFAYNQALIAETIRQRKNGIKGYNSEMSDALTLVSNLGEALEGKWPESKYANKNSKLYLAGELRGIKNDEIIRKNNKPSH